QFGGPIICHVFQTCLLLVLYSATITPVVRKIKYSSGGLVIPRFSVLVFLAASALAQNVVHYTTTIDNVKYLFATAEPVMRLKPGDILDTNTLDCFGNALRKPGDTVSMIKRYNPLAGPFYIEGAEPGDTLAVKILDLQVDGDTGVGGYSPGFGAITGSRYSPVLEP